MTSGSPAAGNAASGIPPETIARAAKAAYKAWQMARGVPEGLLEDCGWDMIGPVPRQRWEAAVAAAAPAILESERARIAAACTAAVAAERERAEALIVQAQDYASAESERADKLAGLALKALNECQALHPTGEAGYLDEWGMALDQLESAAGEMSPPDSDPLEEANQAGIRWERARVIRLAEERSATCLTHHGEPGYPEAGQFADLLREDGNEPA